MGFNRHPKAALWTGLTRHGSKGGFAEPNRSLEKGDALLQLRSQMRGSQRFFAKPGKIMGRNLHGIRFALAVPIGIATTGAPSHSEAHRVKARRGAPNGRPRFADGRDHSPQGSRSTADRCARLVLLECPQDSGKLAENW